MTNNKSEVLFVDECGTSTSSEVCLRSGKLVQKESSRWKATSKSAKRLFHSLFLPEGYPESVAPGYTGYQVFDTAQALCSSVTGVLATQAVLEGVGVGDAAATASAATLQWIMRDGTGMLGRIIFAWHNASDLDCNSKHWRFMADILNDIGMFFELLAPAFPGLFLTLLCLGTLMKAMCGVAGGATRAALTQHFAIRQNMADVSAKDGSQETAVGLFGMFLGMLVTTLVDGDQTRIWTTFIAFTFFHLLTNYMAVRYVCFDTLNRQRFRLLFWRFQSDRDQRVLLAPDAVAERESILWFRSSREWSVKIDLGVPLFEMAQSMPPSSIVDAVSGSSFSSDSYVLTITKTWFGHRVAVSYPDCADVSAVLKSYFQTLLIERSLGNATGSSKGFEDLIARTDVEAEQWFSTFVGTCKESGWDVSRSMLCEGLWRFRQSKHA